MGFTQFSCFLIDVNKCAIRNDIKSSWNWRRSTKLILASKRFDRLNSIQLKKIGVVMKRAQYFIVSIELSMHKINEIKPETIKGLLLNKNISDINYK